MAYARPNRELMYSEDELLMLSGMQHIAFCERQWALIHIEQQWAENVLTIEGQFLHERVNDPFEDESRNDIMTWRSLYLTSYRLGLYGRSDVVELVRVTGNVTDTISIDKKHGRWKLVPVEYKRGKPKPDECDEVQLCAQAMCLEEMFNVNINEGHLYYGTVRRRNLVNFTSMLREQAEHHATRMHELYSKHTTPPAEFKPRCRSCSLRDICLPGTMDNSVSASGYLRQVLDF
jgi:CRISPR-associated exonuclease Cas4